MPFLVGGTNLRKQHKDKGELGLAMHARGYACGSTQSPWTKVGDLYLLEEAIWRGKLMSVSRLKHMEGIKNCLPATYPPERQCICVYRFSFFTYDRRTLEAKPIFMIELSRLERNEKHL